MSSATTPLSYLSSLFAFFSFCDQRLRQRFEAACESSLTAARCSVNDVAGGERKNEVALDRFVKNKRVSLQSLRTSLVQFSFHNLQRKGLKSILAVYDPTLLDFTNHTKKKNRMELANSQQLGYRWHNVAFVEPLSGRLAGIGHTSVISALGPDDADWVDYAPGVEKEELAGQLAFNNKQQFMIYAQRLDALAPEDLEIIHVADREFDDAFTFRAFSKLQARSHYVVRSDEQRVVQVEPAPWIPKEYRKVSDQKWVAGSQKAGLINIQLDELVAALPTTRFGRVPVDKRGRVCKKGEKPFRWAKLEVGVARVRLAKKSERGQTLKVKEEAIWVNVVVVREKTPPIGTEPLHWTLITDLPIETPEQIKRIVEAYLKRWRIEEFFRTCKEFLELEESRVETEGRLAVLLLLVMVKILFLEEIRALAELPSGVVPSQVSRERLKRALARAKTLEANRKAGDEVGPLAEKERGRQLLALIASLGGWRWRSGDHLGNLTLLRGLSKLRALLAEGCYCWLLGDV